MSTKYVIPRALILPRIESLEVAKETDKMVTLIDRYGCQVTRRKNVCVFDTWAEAHAELTRRAEAELAEARRSLQAAQSFADKVRGMKPPTTPEDPK